MKTRLFLFTFIFILISFVYVFDNEQQALLNQTLFLLFPIFAALAGLLTTRIYGFRSVTGKAMLTMTLGFACWAAGELIWYEYKNIIGINPFPSIADVFFLLGYPLMFVGLHMEFGKADVQMDEMKKNLIFLSILLAVILAGIVGYFGIYLAYDATAGFLENAIAMSYGIGDLVLIIGSLFALSLIQTYRGGKFASFWMAIILGFLFTLAADILFAMYTEPYTANLKPYTYIDLLWIAGYLSLAYGMLDIYSHIWAISQKIINREIKN